MGPGPEPATSSTAQAAFSRRWVKAVRGPCEGLQELLPDSWPEQAHQTVEYFTDNARVVFGVGMSLGIICGLLSVPGFDLVTIVLHLLLPAGAAGPVVFILLDVCLFSWAAYYLTTVFNGISAVAGD